MADDKTPERSTLDRMIGSYKRLQEKRTAAQPPAEETPPPGSPSTESAATGGR